jgi:anaerobic C4-dicarboxylate transporter
MKKILFYSVLIVIWAVMVLTYALIIVLLGFDDKPAYGFYGRFGAACACPEMWLLLLGLTLLLRKKLSRLIFKKETKFDSNPAILCLILGVLWLLFTVFQRFTSSIIQQEVIEQYQESSE